MSDEKPKRPTKAEAKEALREQILAELGVELTARSIESFLIERVNAKYAQRIFQKVNTEWERRWNAGQIEGVSEWKWMLAEVKKVFTEEIAKPATYEEAEAMRIEAEKAKKIEEQNNEEKAKNEV